MVEEHLLYHFRSPQYFDLYSRHRHGFIRIGYMKVATSCLATIHFNDSLNTIRSNYCALKECFTSTCILSLTTAKAVTVLEFDAFA